MNLLLAAIFCAAPDATFQVRTLAGETVEGRIATVARETITVTTDAGLRDLPVSTVLHVTQPTAAPADVQATVWIELADGSAIAATSFTVRGDTVALQSVGGKSTELSARHVRSVRMKQQTDEQRAQWDKIRTMPERTDRIVIRKGERIDSLGGVLRDVSKETVHFELDGEVIPVDIGKVEGLVYHHPATDALPPATFRVTDVFGTQLAGTAWTVDQGTVRFQSPIGLQIERALAEIKKIDFSADKVVFLSDLEPLSVEWTPFFATENVAETLRQFYRPKMDRALMRSESAADKGKLQLLIQRDGVSTALPYDKGIAMHSRTTLVFNVPRDARHFRALAGIDARVVQHGHVRFVIRCDGEDRYSEEIAGSDPPRELALDVTGVRRLEFFVDFGNNLDVGDHLNLCNARLIK